MKPDSEWRQKYFDALEKLEHDEARWRKLENVLRLLTGRLCLAATGRSPRLDGEVRRVGNLIRSHAPQGELEAVLEPLSRAIAALDEMPAANDKPAGPVSPRNTRDTTQSPGIPPVAASDPEVSGCGGSVVSVGQSDAGCAQAIAATLERLAFLPELRPALDGLRNKPSCDLSINDLAEALDHLTGIITEQRARLMRDKLEVESVLMQVNTRLEEMTAHLSGTAADVKTAHDSSQQLNQLVLAEVSDITTTVQQAGDITELRKQVGMRLDAIHAHLQAFRDREEERGRQQLDRTQRMRARIEELERESRDLHESLKEEQRLAMVDALTGIPNRAAYDDRIVEEYERWKRNDKSVSILAWDIDHFKRINDAYGHKAGDKVLRVIGQHLAQHVRGTDFVARYGGEEFVMLLVGTDVEQARSAADKIRHSISSLGFHFRNVPVTVTASCGITSFRADDSTEGIFDRADRALYKAKAAGRNCCVVL
jgi:diguanylate cyclase